MQVFFLKHTCIKCFVKEDSIPGYVSYIFMYLHWCICVCERVCVFVLKRMVNSFISDAGLYTETYMKGGARTHGCVTV